VTSVTKVRAAVDFVRRVAHLQDHVGSPVLSVWLEHLAAWDGVLPNSAMSGTGHKLVLCCCLLYVSAFWVGAVELHHFLYHHQYLSLAAAYLPCAAFFISNAARLQGRLGSRGMHQLWFCAGVSFQPAYVCVCMRVLWCQLRKAAALVFLLQRKPLAAVMVPGLLVAWLYCTCTHVGVVAPFLLMFAGEASRSRFVRACVLHVYSSQAVVHYRQGQL
jgi:hypothetical protein